MKFFIKDFFCKYDSQLWSHLLKKSLMENFIFLCNDFFRWKKWDSSNHMYNL